MRGVSQPASARTRPPSWSASRTVTPGAGSSGGPLEGTPALLGGERLGELVEVAGEDLVELVDRQFDAMVGDPVLREVVRADLLRALPGADLGAPRFRDLRLLALALDLVEPRPQDPHCLLLVLELRLLVLHRDDEPRRQVGDAHGRVR